MFLPNPCLHFEGGNTPGVIGAGTRRANMAGIVKASKANVRAIRAGKR